jgi:tetratricopeptide (TPR) repeat protein
VNHAQHPDEDQRGTEEHSVMKHVSWIVPTLLAAALYAPAILGERVWDDTIVQNKQIVAFKSIKDVFLPPDHIPQWASMYCRPMVTATYLLDAALFERDSTKGPHAMVVLYHTIATLFASILIGQVLRGFQYRWWGALAGGIIFALHPIHTESVCWITGRSDTVAAMFMFPAMVTAIHYRDRKAVWALLLSPLLFLCAAFSKEVALSALLVLPFLLLLVPPSRSTDRKEQQQQRGGVKTGAVLARLFGSWALLALYAVATLIYFVMRTKADAGYGKSLDMDPGEILGRVAGALAYYFAKVVVPSPQSCLVLGFPGTIFTPVVLVIAGAGFVWACWRWKHGQPVWALSFLWFGFTLAPSLAIALRRISEAPLAERYLYLPSLALSFVIGAVLSAGLKARSIRLPAVVMVFAVACAYGYGTVLRGLVWQNNIALWSDTVEKEPESGLAWGHLGKAYMETKGSIDLDKALECYEKAVKVYDDAEGRSISLNSIAAIYATWGENEKAIKHWKAAIAERPSYPSPYFNIGNIYAHKVEQIAKQEKRIDFKLLLEAQSYLQRAIQLDPRYRKALLRLARCQMQAGIYHSLFKQQGEPALDAFQQARQTARRLIEVDVDGPFAQQAQKIVQLTEQQIERLNR